MIGSDTVLGGHWPMTRPAIQVLLDPLAVARHREAEDEVDRGDEEIASMKNGRQSRRRARGQRAGQLVQADDRDQRGVLERR